MSNTIKKYKMQQVLNANNDTLELHPMTDADIVNYTNIINGVTVNNVNDAIDRILSIPKTDFVSIDTEDYNNSDSSVTIPNSIGNQISKFTVLNLYEHAGAYYDDYYYCIDFYADDEDTEAIYTFSNGNYSFQIVHDITNDTYEMSERLPFLIFDESPTANSNNPVKSSGVYNAIQNVIEIAEGKTKNYVISDATVSGYDNALFNSTLNNIVISIGNVNYGKFRDILGNDIYFTDLKVGDIVSITETDVPDRWLASKTYSEYPSPEWRYTFYKMETKIDVTDAITNNDARPVTSNAVRMAMEFKQHVIDANHKVSANFITETTDKQFTSSTEKATWNGKYDKPSTGIPSSDLADSGISAGTYSAVSVNAKGQATAGGQIVEIGSSNQTTPSSSLVVGGIFFKEI